MCFSIYASTACGSGLAAPFRGEILAPVSCLLNPHGNIVTNSSDAVGWIATQESKSALVAPIFIAIPNPCNISSAPIPILDQKEAMMSFNEHLRKEVKLTSALHYLPMT